MSQVAESALPASDCLIGIVLAIDRHLNIARIVRTHVERYRPAADLAVLNILLTNLVGINQYLDDLAAVRASDSLFIQQFHDRFSTL